MSGFFAPDDISLEEWRPIIDYPNYEVSNFGRVRSYCVHGHSQLSNESKVLSGRIRGYHFIGLTNKKGLREFQIHRLVLTAFVGLCPKDHQTNHKDGNKLNNRLENLEWTTCGENHAHAFRTGLRSQKGELGARAKLKDNEVRHIKQLLWLRLPQKEIAERFNVSGSAIRAINIERSWSHIKFVPADGIC